jgi:hypothetical protein
MATSYTTFLGLALPVTGELSGTWGDTVNNYISNYIDAAVAGAQTVTTDTTLTKTTGTTLGATSSQYAIIIASPASANITITAPAASKIYTIINTSATYTVKIVGAGPTTGVTLGVSEKAQVAWNGSDFVRIGASGGPGVFSSITNTGLTSGRVVYSTTGGLETDSANLLFNGTTLTANTLNLTNALGTTYGGTGLTSFTANGVVYASSSSALTTGSALTFDGTTVKSPILFASSTDAGGSVLQVNTTSTAYGRVGGSTTMGYVAGAQSLWTIGGTEQMRLTSTGLGIGTSSPGEKLQVAGAIRATGAVAANATGGILAYQGSSTVVLGSWGADASTYGAIQFYQSNSAGTLNRTGMLLDSSGNLGLGVTPSAWNAGSPVIQMAGGTSIYADPNQTIYGLNAAFISGFKYVVSDFASQYIQVNGQHQWQTAPSGTAGNLITFTQAMTLDESGNLAIGTTAAYGRLDVAVSTGSGVGSTTTLNISSGNQYGNAGNEKYLNLDFLGYRDGVGSNGIKARIQAIEATGQDRASGLYFYTTPTSGVLTQRAIIDSSGNLLVGTTSVTPGSGYGGVCILPDGGVLVTCSSNPLYRGYSLNSGSPVFNVANNGNVSNTNNSYGAISDAKLKENIVDATPKLVDLMQVKVRNYNLIGESTKQLGVVAQELETVFPSMIEETLDRDAEGNDLGTTTKSVKYSVFVPMLIKAMQEQQAMLQLLTDRISQLEAK